VEAKENLKVLNVTVGDVIIRLSPITVWLRLRDIAYDRSQIS